MGCPSIAQAWDYCLMAKLISEIDPAPTTGQYARMLLKHGKNGADKCTEARLKAMGCYTERAERWSGKGMVKHDLFGCVDWIGIDPKTFDVLCIQATSVGKMKNRARKIVALPHWPVLMRTALRFEVWGWDDSGVCFELDMKGGQTELFL